MRVLKSKYVLDWEENKQAEIKKLTSQGIVPVYHDLKRIQDSGEEVDPNFMIDAQPLLSGQVAGNIDEVLPAKKIMDDMIAVAVAQIKHVNGLVSASAKL